MTTKLSIEDQNRILFWIESGCDIIAANTVKKDDNKARDKVLEKWTEFRNTTHSSEYFKKNLKSGKYDKGVAVLCGKFQRGPHEGKYLNVIDFDKKLGITEYLQHGDKMTTMQNIADEITLVEHHEGDDNSYHLFLITNTPLKSKGADDKVGIETKSETGLIFVSPSVHSSLNKYKPHGKITENIQRLDDIQKLELEQHIDYVCKRHGIPYLSDPEKKKVFDWLERDDTVIKIGSRHNVLTHIMVSYFFRWGYDKWNELTDEQRYQRVLEYDRKHCVPPLSKTDPEEVESLWEWIKKNCTGKRQQERDQREDDKKKDEKSYTHQNDSHSKHKYEKFKTWDKTIRDRLYGNKWTQVSETPLKFIMADYNEKHIVRVSISSGSSKENNENNRKSGTAQKLAYSFNAGTIVLKCIPTEVTIHKNPLKFLRSELKYTMRFVTQSNQRFILERKTIDEIISSLKQMALNISPYGVTEALNAIIQAFEEDGELKVNESADFVGFYLEDGNIRMCNLAAEDGPIYTQKQEEIIETAKILNDLVSLYPDRVDLFSTFINWGIVAPFSFVLKQIGNNGWLKWLHSWGAASTGKITLGRIVMAIDNHHHEDSKFILPYSSIDSPARFGEAISKTTFPLCINEVSLDDKQKQIINLTKTAIESPIIRSKFMHKTIPIDIPALSACIFTGNPPPPTSDTAYMRRMIDREFSKQEYHKENDEKTRIFESFLVQNISKLRVLGEFRVGYILNHQKELILDGKLKPLEIGQKVLEAFYEYAGMEKPDWIYKLLPENQIEEAIKDVESLVRRALFDLINSTYRINIGSLRGSPDVSIQGRLECCDKHLLSFIKEGEVDEIIIDGSIMQELWNNSRNGLDPSIISGLQALGDVIGFTYGKRGKQTTGHDNRRRVIFGSKDRLINFLNDIENF